MSQEKINDEVLNWYAKCDNKGISSESLANTATQGVKSDAGSFCHSPPSDNSDFKRCIIFKVMCPTAFARAKEILKDEPVWNEYFNNWKKMENLLQFQQDGKNDGMELFNLMQDIQKKAQS